jgi:phosphoglycerate dehydrogenase-like enzyme
MTPEKICVAVLDDFEKLADTVAAYEELKGRAEVAIFYERLDTTEKIVQALADFDAILLMRERTRLSEKEYSRLPKLKLISQTGRTTGHLDLAAATKRGIRVAGTPGDNGAGTKELTIGLILALLRRIPQVDRRMRTESWPPIAGEILEGKTVGVLGFGRIGKEVARILKLFNTRVLAYSRSLTPDRTQEIGAECVSLETLLRESDIVTVHINLNAQTRGLIGEREIGLMKRGAFLVNTARGPLVDESAMIKALQSGQLGGVGLDVFDVEPLPKEHPLRRCDNAVLLSHRGYATREVLKERYQQALVNVLKFMDHEPLDLLNPDVAAGHSE